MEFNTKKILSLILLSIALVSCNEGLDGFIDSTETTLQETNWAKEYYEQLPNRSTRLGVQKGKSKGVAVRPGWKHTIKEQGSWYSFVETDLVTEKVFNFVLPVNAARYQETGDGRYLISQTHFVFRKSPVMEDMFYMTIIPSADYLEKTKFEPFKKMSYMKRDKSFSGIILFHDQNGEFANGWKYKDGLVTEAIVKMDEEQRFTRKLNSDEDTIKMLMNDGYIMYYSEGGGYSYTMTTLGDDVVDFEVKTTKSYDIPYYSTSVNDSYSSNHDYGSMEDEHCSSNYESPTSGYGYAHVGGYASSGGKTDDNTNQIVNSNILEKVNRNGKLNSLFEDLHNNVVSKTNVNEDGIIIFANGSTLKPTNSTPRGLSYPLIPKGKKVSIRIHGHPRDGGATPSPGDWRVIGKMIANNQVDKNDFYFGVATCNGDIIITIKNESLAREFIEKTFGNASLDKESEDDFAEYRSGKSYFPSYINYINKIAGGRDCSGVEILWRDTDSNGLTVYSNWEIIK